MYAIPRVDNTEKIRSRKRAHHIGIDSDSDSDADFLPRKKNTCGAEFDILMNEIFAMQDQLRRILQLIVMKIPMALQSLLMDSFKCHICQKRPSAPLSSLHAAANLL